MSDGGGGGLSEGQGSRTLRHVAAVSSQSFQKYFFVLAVPGLHCSAGFSLVEGGVYSLVAERGLWGARASGVSAPGL